MRAGQGFAVDPGAVRGLGDLVLRAGAGADDFREWFDRVLSGGGGTDTERGEGFLANAWPKLDEWQRTAMSQTRTAAGLAEGGGRELHCVAHWYLVVDRAAAELLDRLNPEPDAARIPPDEVVDPGAAASFRDAVPAGYNGPDPAQIENPDWWPVKAEKMAEELGGLGGSLGDIAELIKILSGSDKDFITMIADAVVGDWTVLQQQAVLYADAAAGFANIATNINQGRFGIQEPWHGEAADQAKNWLTAYHSSVTQLAHYFQGASMAIQALARIAYHYMQEIRHLVSAAIDIALLILTKGKSLALRRGLSLAEVISEALAELGRGVDLVNFLKDGDLMALVQLIISLSDVVSLIQTAISALLGLAHQFEKERAIEDLLETTIAMGDPPQWPESYEHRDADCPAKGRKVLL
jgi:hypothetical protein